MAIPAARFRAAAWAMLLVAGPRLFAADRYVDCQNGNDLTGDGSLGNPFQTIARGVAQAASGDTVRIKAGVCDETNQTSFPVDMKPGVSVVGAGKTATFIRNQGAVTGAAAFYFAQSGGSFPSTQLLADMDIQTDADGISLWNGSPTIRNNVIHGGSSAISILTLYSGEASSPTIENNTILEMGRGVKLQALSAPSSLLIRRNWFLGSAVAGIAQYAIDAQDVGTRPVLRIENNVMANTRVGAGFLGGSPTITNNTISNTSEALVFSSSTGSEVQVAALDNNIIAYNEYGVVESGGVDTTVASLRNNDFFVNSLEDYFDTLLGPVVDPDSLPNASGNLGVNPSFLDPTRNDFHLHPSSALRDAGAIAGAPADDIDGQARSDGAPDVGADETSNIGAPNLRVTAHRVVADLCPGSNPPGGNGVLDPGEVGDIRWEVTNLAPFARATNVTATITGDAGIFPQPQTVSFGKINPLQTVQSAVFSFHWEPSGLNCGAKIRFDLVLSSTETGTLPPQSYEIKRPSCTPCLNPLKPDPVLDSTDLEDECPNGIPPGFNGSIEPGETGRLTFNVTNNSSTARATGVTARVTTSTPGITPSSGTVLLGNILPGATRSNATPFEFSVDPAQVSCGGTIVFNVALDWVELPPTAPTPRPVSFNVPSPCVNCAAVLPAFALGSRTFTDSCSGGSPNNRIDPGDTINLTIQVQNTSAQAGASSVTGTLYALTSGVTPPAAALNFGSIGPTQTVAAPPVQLRIAKTLACGSSLNFELELASDQTGVVPARLPFSLSVATPCTVCNDVPPTLSLSGPSFNDICLGSNPPGANAQVDPGETIELTVNVFNSSNVATATGVTASLSIAEPWVDPRQGTLLIDTVPPLSTRPSTFPFTFAVERSSTLCGQFINIDVTLDSRETGPVAQPPLRLLVDGACNICPVPQPVLAVNQQTFTDRCPFSEPPGNNGVIEPGEIVDLVLEIGNGSLFAPATGVTAAFSTATPGISPAAGAVAGPDIAPSASGQLDPFSFAVDYTQVACGATIPFDVRLSSVETGPLPIQTLNVRVGPACSSICREVVSGLLLYRATVPAIAPGWKPAVLPLTSLSPGKDPSPWPQPAVAPGEQWDTGILSSTAPLLLYRLLDGADASQGNTLLLAKRPLTQDIHLRY